MKNILYLANIRLPTEKAHGLQIMENCSAFAKVLPAKIILVVPSRVNKIKQNPFLYYNLDPIFSIEKIWCLDFLLIPIFNFFWFILETFTFVISAFIYYLVNKKNIDILYTRDVGIAAFMPGQRPLYFEIHNLPANKNWFYRRALKRVKGIIVISEGLKTDLVGWGADPKKILLARDGVNLEKFLIKFTKDSARQRLGIPVDQKIVVYTGHLYTWKGTSLLAESADLLPNVSFYFIGGTEKEIIHFKELYQKNNINIIGQRPQAEIPIWLAAADVLVLPNSAKEKISSKYTSPLKLFEYMASERVIVAANLPSIHEVLSETEAVFFKPDDVKSLAAALDRALEHVEASIAKASTAKDKVQQYDWQERAKLIGRFIGL